MASSVDKREAAEFADENSARWDGRMAHFMPV